MNSDLVRGWKRSCLNHPGHIGLPESTDHRTLRAAAELLAEGSFRRVHLYEKQAVVLAEAEVANVDLNAFGDRIVWAIDETTSQVSALEVCAQDLHHGDIDVALAGAVNTTAAVIRAAISNVGLAPGCRTISGLFVMNKMHEDGTQHTMFYADAGVVIDPTPEQLADIAWSTAESWRCLMGSEQPPVVAFLSFSTKGSARHASVEKVAKGLEIFQQRHPHVISDGELQFDAAYIESIGQRKCPDSPVVGKANCFIFPNLDAGNICYKVTQRLAKYEAYGPVLQGSRKPFSDLSRGATTEDIKASAYINLLRARNT